MERQTKDSAGPQELWEARARLHAGAVEWPPGRQVVLVDIDGTLSNPQHRLHFIQPPQRQGGQFRGHKRQARKD